MMDHERVLRVVAFVLMLGIALLMVEFVCMVVDASTTWYSSAMFHPDASLNYYSFYSNRSDISNVTMNSTTFNVGSYSYTSDHEVNVSIVSLALPLNYSVTGDDNMTICGLPLLSKYNAEYSTGSEVYSVSPFGCINFVTYLPTFVYISQSISSCSSQRYYMIRNSTYYVYGYNETFSFSCLPLQYGCQPKYQNPSVFSALYTNTYTNSMTVTMSLNTTSPRGYSIYANTIPVNSSAFLLSTNKVIIDPVLSPGGSDRFWFYINTYYPFQSYNAYIDLEVCS